MLEGGAFGVADGCAAAEAERHGLTLPTYRETGRGPMRGDVLRTQPRRLSAAALDLICDASDLHDPDDTTTPAAPEAVRIGPGDC